MSTTGPLRTSERRVDRVLLARVHWYRGDTHRALAALRSVAPDEPERAAADELRADIGRSNGELDEWERAGLHVRPPSGRPFDPAPYVRWPHFLDQTTCARLQAMAAAHRDDFVPSLVAGGILDPGQRRGLRLRHPPTERAARRQFLARFEPELPGLIDRLAPGAGPAPTVDCTITASIRDGFFGVHRDDRNPDGPATDRADRVLSFVCWFHREPARFTGGELVLHDSTDRWWSQLLCTMFRPRAGTLVVFPSRWFHGVRPVGGDVTDVADGRLAITGHVNGPLRTGPPG